MVLLLDLSNFATTLNNAALTLSPKGSRASKIPMNPSRISSSRREFQSADSPVMLLMTQTILSSTACLNHAGIRSVLSSSVLPSVISANHV